MNLSDPRPGAELASRIVSARDFFTAEANRMHAEAQAAALRGHAVSSELVTIVKVTDAVLLGLKPDIKITEAQAQLVKGMIVSAAANEGIEELLVSESGNAAYAAIALAVAPICTFINTGGAAR